MRIAVIVGSVLDPSGIVVNRRAGRLFVNREEYIIHPADRAALEAALRIKDSTDCEVVALARSPLHSDDVLRQALSRGADRAISIPLGEKPAESADTAVMAHMLAAALRRLDPVQLVLLGSTTLDMGSGQLGPRLAEALGWPQILSAWEVAVDKGHVQAVVATDDGFVRAKTAAPVLVTVPPGALTLRYANGVKLINVYRAANVVESWEAHDLVAETELRATTTVLGRDFPPERERAVRVAGPPDEMAKSVCAQILSRVRE